MADYVELLLQASRNGNLAVVEELLKVTDVDINCKGKHKSNLGWSPLHLATYFGHLEVVETLLQHNADVNVINGMGDTPLHRAAFTGRTNVVLALLRYNADVSIINGEGRTPLQMSDNPEVKKLIEAAEKSQQLSRNEFLLQATTEGDTAAVKALLGSSVPPNINHQNLLGNTALHCAGYRGHKEIAVLLLQNGIDSTIKNNRGLSALEVSKDPKMRQLLDVQPLQAVQKTVQRFEGYVMKKSKLFGWKKHWIVVERGILSAFQNRADASSGLKRQFFKYLDNAKIAAHQQDETKFKIEYSDHTIHFFMTAGLNTGQVDRQRWLNTIRKHAAYSTHYTSQPHIILMDELDEDYLPLGSMDDAIQNANAHQQVLDQQVKGLLTYFDTLSDQQIRQGMATTLKTKLTDIVSTSKEVCSTLGHCLTVLMQQEEVRRLQLQEEAEKRRVLEDALHVLAREHFVLEQSVRSSHKMMLPSFSEDNEELMSDIFYDAPETLSDHEFSTSYQEDSCVQDEEKENGLQQELLQTNFQIANGGNTDGIIPSENIFNLSDSKQKLSKYRIRLPHSMHSRNEFSIWSVLKQAVGKDLSRITMPVIFNEPLSFLQRIAEYMDYVELLHKISEIDDSIERLLLVTVFMISCNASTEGRVGKPFNPLLGETYELVRDDLGFKLMAEQVSHHPPVSALYAESKSGFQLQMSMQPELKFWGKDIEVRPKGNVIIKIPKYGDVYTFPYVSSGVHNIIIGNLWIELYGMCEIKNHSTGEKAVVNFKPAGWFGKDMNQVEGYIMNTKNEKKILIKSDWTKYICSCPADKGGLLKDLENAKTINGIPIIPDGVKLEWSVRPKPDCAADMYMMTEFAMSLNHLLDEHKNTIAPTDCRYRPDIRQLENGNIEGAAADKLRLEEKQRATRRKMNASHEIWEPRWFTLEENEWLGCKEWIYNHQYFQRNFQKCPDIY